MLTKVSWFRSYILADMRCLFLLQTFKERLVEVIDQAQHFAALGTGGGSGSASGDSAQTFREGLDGTERERAYTSIFSRRVLLNVCSIVFALAQESAKRTKLWYEGIEKAR